VEEFIRFDRRGKLIIDKNGELYGLIKMAHPELLEIEKLLPSALRSLMRILINFLAKYPHIMGKGIPALLKECVRDSSRFTNVCSEVYDMIKAVFTGAWP
jgi:hypothetical protein